MALKSIALASAATLALCVGANGAWAQQTDPSQYSTPSEHAQTEQLNAQGSNGVNASPEELNGQADDASGPPPPSAQDQQYQQQLQINRQQQMQYQRQSADYQAQYGDNPPPPAGYERTSYPRAPRYDYSDHKLWTLGRIEDPTHQLAQLPIEGPDGRWVGKVRNVDLDTGGIPRRIEVALDPDHSVWVAPGHFKYDAHERVLFSDLSYDQLWRHQGATWESSEP